MPFTELSWEIFLADNDIDGQVSGPGQMRLLGQKTRVSCPSASGKGQAWASCSSCVHFLQLQEQNSTHPAALEQYELPFSQFWSEDQNQGVGRVVFLSEDSKGNFFFPCPACGGCPQSWVWPFQGQQCQLEPFSCYIALTLPFCLSLALLKTLVITVSPSR